MIFREVTEEDLPVLIRLLMDDWLGQTRENLSAIADYQEAFSAIVQSPNQLLLGLEEDGELIGCVQITYLASLSFQGMSRAQLEGVRIRSDRRGQGHGKRLIQEAIRRAKKRGCGMVQLTTNKKRSDAVAFYKSLGFEDSHIGMKLML